MSSQNKYTKREVEKLFAEAARMAEPSRPQAGYDAQTVRRAAKEAGIADGQLERAIRRLEARKAAGLSLVLVAVLGALAIGALLLFPGALFGPSDRTVLIHNDNRDRAHTVEVLVPEAEAAEPASCEQSPEQRVAATDYCVTRRLRLEPRARVRIEVPQRPSSCPQIWVRVLEDEYERGSALFTLPAGVEIDERGHMDQKGAGRPDMHPEPDGVTGTRLPRCASGTAGGAL